MYQIDLFFYLTHNDKVQILLFLKHCCWENLHFFKLKIHKLITCRHNTLKWRFVRDPTSISMFLSNHSTLGHVFAWDSQRWKSGGLCPFAPCLITYRIWLNAARCSSLFLPARLKAATQGTDSLYLSWLLCTRKRNEWKWGWPVIK